MTYNNNTMRNRSLHLYGVPHGIIVVCHNLVACIHHPSFSSFWHCHAYIIQHFNENVFTLTTLTILIPTGFLKPLITLNTYFSILLFPRFLPSATTSIHDFLLLTLTIESIPNPCRPSYPQSPIFNTPT